MAYKYQQNLYNGAAQGYVRYDITPAPGTYLAPGERVTISGQAYYRDAAVYGVVVELSVGDEWSDPDNYRFIVAAQKAVKIAKGRTGTFSMSFTLTERTAQILGEGAGRAFDALIGFTLADDSSLSGGLSTVRVAAQKVSILKSRVAPVIESAVFSDDTGAAAYFGGFVQGESRLMMTLRTKTDPLDSAVTIVQRELVLGGAPYSLRADEENIGAVNLNGEASWTLTVTDSKGLSSQVSGTIELLAYHPPEITALTAQRYCEVVADDGTVSYEAADDGEHVRFSLTGSVCAVAGRNAWTLNVDGVGGERVVRTGADGMEIMLEDDREAMPAAVSASERAEFAWTIRDYFHSVTMRAAVDKAEAYFDVEKHGVAVGMRSAGKPWDRRFEVDKRYKSHFYGGAYGADGYRMDRCEQWEYLDITNGNFAAYNAAFRPRISRVGAIVFLDGMVKNTADLEANFNQTIAALPEWARPVTDVHAIQQGSGRAVWWQRITASGAVIIHRYRDEDGYAAAAATSQFPLSLSWIAADAFVAPVEGEVIVTYADGMVTLTDTGDSMEVVHDGAGNVTIEKYSGVTVAVSDGSVAIEKEE